MTTTAPTPASAAPTLFGTDPTVDRALDGTAHTSAAFLAGLIAAAMLDTVGRPAKLPDLLFPDLPPEAVQRVWDTALAVGYRAGRLAVAPRFHRDTLARLRDALSDAGYTAMARTAGHTARAAAAEPEPDHERTPTGGDDTRGGHW
ncbi:hypothetical protein ACWD4O_38720 [Streptomyces sp. NPDC002623]